MFFNFLVPTDKLRTPDVSSGQEDGGIVVNIHWRGLWGGTEMDQAVFPL
jgi:hypothetical protein